MSENIELYSSHVITRQELEEVITEAGGVLTGKGHVGRISQGGTKHVFIWLDDEEPIPGTDLPYGGHELSVQEAIRSKLGTDATYALVIEIGMTPGSGLLAVHFALTCTQHWPCVVFSQQFEGETIRPPLDNILKPIELKGDFVNKVFDQDDMLQLQREGKGFIQYGM